MIYLKTFEEYNPENAGTVWYHGSNSEDFNDTKYGVYFAQDEKYAKQYGDVNCYVIRKLKPLVIDNEKMQRKYLAVTFDTFAKYLDDDLGIKREGDNYKKLKSYYKNFYNKSVDKNEFMDYRPIWQFFTRLGNEKGLELYIGKLEKNIELVIE